MKQRFVANKTSSPYRNMVISIIIFVLLLGLFYVGISSMSKRTAAQEMDTLETAISRGVAHCYAVEGSYPENLAYLKDHYGLTYDEDRFFVDYKILGRNILPDVTVIDKEDSQ